MKKIYLVQRCVLKPDYPRASRRFSENVELEYMGSAEFEFGILPKSLRAMAADDFGVKKVHNILDKNNRPLLVYSNLNVFDFAEYVAQLKDLREGKNNCRTKERTNFEDPKEVVKSWVRTNIWWDVENNVIWTFERKFANVLHDSILKSVIYMDEKVE